MRRLTLTFAICGLLVVPAAARADPAWVPGRVVVQLEPHAASVKAVAAAAGTPAQTVTAVPASPAQVIQLRPGQSVLTAVARLNRRADVRYAVPDYIGRASGEWLPDDPGRGRTRGGWRKVQWNFLGATGINAPVAWWNLIRAGHPGGRGVRIAVVDTGVAYKTFGRWKRSPDFNRTRFAAGWDFVGNDSHPYDF